MPRRACTVCGYPRVRDKHASWCKRITEYLRQYKGG